VTTRVAAIVGPTATGKSAAAVAVARRTGAEIVSVDSMQVYRGMDVGTAKATQEMRSLVPHHMLDVRPASHRLTVAEFQSSARAAIHDVTARGRLPLLVGGSGLYFRAVVDDLRFPSDAPERRAHLEEEAARGGSAVLYERLRVLDPEAAGRIEPDNVRRIVRALEAIDASGRRFSESRAWDDYESIYELRVAGLKLSRAKLDERIAARVDAMFAAGLVDEVRRLEREGLGPTARQALGYRQVLEAPGAPEKELRAAIVAATKSFARRQESWFGADPRVRWYDADAPDLVDRLSEYLG
jgi:tRNA dimethylallyltransferase